MTTNVSRIALALLLLAACSRNTIQQPSANNGWQNFALRQTSQLNNPFALNPTIGYVITNPRNLAIGRTIELNYTITGDGDLATPEDNPPAQITLLLWRSGDDFSGKNEKQNYRLWCGGLARGQLTPGDHIMRCAISQNWTGVNGRRVGEFPGALQDVLNNASSIGFTCGGRDFFGKGCFGSGSMRINSFAVN